ncbi:MAG: hypothetical protein ACM3JI_04815 [Anaerolineae bacterium]
MILLKNFFKGVFLFTFVSTWYLNAESHRAALLQPGQPLPSSVDEVTALDEIIDLSEKQLSNYKHLRHLILEFKNQKEQFLEQNLPKKQVSHMLKTSKEILEIITSSKINHFFPNEYLDELAVFSSVASKKSPVRP